LPVRRRPIIIAVAALVLVSTLVGGGLWAINRSFHAAIERRFGPVHRYPLKSEGAFLTDSRAIALAREVMSLDGYAPAHWEPLEDRRTKAPNGTPDIYIARNESEPNRGTITFRCTDSTAVPERDVVFEPDGEELIVRTYLPK
jgi:hypothetical protein